MKAYPIYRRIKGYEISRAVSSYKEDNMQHFNIRYTQGDDEVSEVLKSYIEEYGSQVFEFFEYTPRNKLEVILFPDKESFHQILKIPKNQSTIGVYSGMKISLLSPQEQEGFLLNAFVHELAHLIVDEIAGGNYPLWFTEGSALYLEYYLLGYEWGEELEGEESYSIQQLNDDFQSLDEYLAYRQSFILVRQLIEGGGREKYLDLLRSLGQGESFMKLLEKCNVM